MADLAEFPWLKDLFMIFALTWGLGLIGRIILNPAKYSDTLDETATNSDPFYRQIRVVGPLRWLFGYKPVTGPVSMVGAICQLAAYLTVVITIGLALVWPDVLHALYWLPFVILTLTIVFAGRFMLGLWDKQHGKK